MEKLVFSDIRSCFDEIVPGLLTVAHKNREEWRPEDVYAMCATGEYHLFRAKNCFIVCQERTVKIRSMEKVLFIWICYGRGRVRDYLMPMIKDLARSIGAQRIEMLSKRTGYLRTGWTPRGVLYEMEV